MSSASLPDFYQYLKSWSEDIDLLRQNNLLDESQMVTFAKERGISLHGLGRGDAGIFHARGWLKNDGVDYRGQPTFHPFRIFTLGCLLNDCGDNAEASQSLNDDRYLWATKGKSVSLPSSLSVSEGAKYWSSITDLAILLEPIYWPYVTGWVGGRAGINKNERALRKKAYNEKTLQLVKTLDPITWQEAHEQLCIDAADIDENSELYLFLRLAKWEKRKELKGRISEALWLRHMAEVIRLAFEEAHAVKWLEEDQGFGYWPAGARARTYGSERPLDDELKSRPYLAFEYGYHTGSAVRWYVEGETEYHAVLHVFPEPARYHIELVNLKGNLATDKDNIALKLNDQLEQDKAQKRFSMITGDDDVAENVKKIRRQLEKKNIVGFINWHIPDFEFANFSILELVEIAATVDEANGSSGDALRKSDWAGIEKGRSFEEKYLSISERRPQRLKGKEWGTALAQYMVEHPYRMDNNQERPFLGAIRAAHKAQIASYDFHQEQLDFDLETFKHINVKKAN